MATFAERLRSLRQEKGWSQQRLADNLKLSKSSVNMYERGEREPGFETMEAIADLFNVDMNYLYGRTDVKIADPIVWDTDSSLAHSPIPPGFIPMPQMPARCRWWLHRWRHAHLAQQNIDGQRGRPRGHPLQTLPCAARATA